MALPDGSLGGSPDETLTPTASPTSDLTLTPTAPLSAEAAPTADQGVATTAPSGPATGIPQAQAPKTPPLAPPRPIAPPAVPKPILPSQQLGSTMVAADRDPKQWAEVMQMAQQLGVTPQFASQNYDHLKATITMQNQRGAVAGTSAGLQNWLANPDHATLAKHEMDAVTRLGANVQTVTAPKTNAETGLPATQQHLGLPLAAVKSGVVDLAQTATLLRAIFDPNVSDLAKAQDAQAIAGYEATKQKMVGEAPDVAALNAEQATQGTVPDLLAPTTDRMAQLRNVLRTTAIGAGAVAAIEEVGNIIRHPKAFAYNTIQGLPAMVPLLVGTAEGTETGAIGGPVGAFAGGLVGGTLGYAPVAVGNQLKVALAKRGVDIGNPAQLEAVLRDPSALAEMRSIATKSGVTEAAAMALFTGVAGTMSTRMAQGMLKVPTAKAVAAGATARELGATAAEQASAITQTFATHAPTFAEKVGAKVAGAAGQATAMAASQQAANLAKGEPLSAEEFAKSTVQNLGIGAIFEAAHEARAGYHPSPEIAAAELTVKSHEALRALQDHATLMDIGRAAKEAETTSSVPSALQELVHATTSEADPVMYFQKAAWDEHWKAQGQDPEAMAAQMMGDEGKGYRDAGEAGTRLAVPLAEAIPQLGPTPHWDALLQTATMTPDGPTVAEANAHLKTIDPVMRSLVAEVQAQDAKTAAEPLSEFEQQSKTIQQDLQSQLQAAGRPVTEARAGASLLTSVVRALADRHGVTPREAMALMPSLDFSRGIEGAVEGLKQTETNAKAQSAAGPNAPGVGLSPENRLGFAPSLRVAAPKNTKVPEKPLILTGTTNKNAARQIAAIDGILTKFPKAMKTVADWTRMMVAALGSDEVPIPPYALIRDLKAQGAVKRLQSLTAGQIADASSGMDFAQEVRKAYTAGELSVADTGKLFLWSMLSRGVSPYTQESLFIDAFKGIDPWIEKAAAGNMTPADFEAYREWGSSVSPKGSGQPGSGATHNLNAFGTHFLEKLGRVGEDGKTGLQRLHEMMSDPQQTGRNIRRAFATMGEGVGIDNKVVSFTLLVAGFTDVMVLDRVQMRNLWDDGRFNGQNLYDGQLNENGDRVTGTSLAPLGDGVRGLLVYEAIERSLAEHVSEIYKALGRESDASVGRFHWESWVAASQQEAGHETLSAILRTAQGDDAAIARVGAKQGEYGAYEYGATYLRDAESTPYFRYQTPLGGKFEFSVPAWRAFLADIKKPANGVIPTNFKVTESGNAPWFERPEVNREALDQRAAFWADRSGGTGQGASALEETARDEGIAYGAGTATSPAAAPAEGVVPPQTLYQRVASAFPNAWAPPFYSKAERLVAEKVPNNATPDQVKATLAGIKAEERKWLGIDEFLAMQSRAGKTTVDKAELQQWLAANNLQLKLVEDVRSATGIDEDDFWAASEFSARELASDFRLWGEYYDIDGRDTIEDFEARSIDEKLAELQSVGIGVVESRGDVLHQDYTLKLSPAEEAAGLLQTYKEYVITMPDAEGTFYAEHHWGDTKNPIGHFRVIQREVFTKDGTSGRSFHIEEIQTDAQLEARKLVDEQIKKRLTTQGIPVPHVKERKSSPEWQAAAQAVKDEGFTGYFAPESEQALRDATEAWQVADNAQDAFERSLGAGAYDADLSPEQLAQRNALALAEREALVARNDIRRMNADLIPDFPFKGKWNEFALKRIIRLAAEQGFDRISWTTGEQTQDRYPGITQDADKVQYDPNTKTLTAFEGWSGRKVAEYKDVAPNKIADYIGRDVAERLLETPQGPLTGEAKKAADAEVLRLGNRVQRLVNDLEAAIVRRNNIPLEQIDKVTERNVQYEIKDIAAGELEDWQKQHPDATPEEISAQWDVITADVTTFVRNDASKMDMARVDARGELEREAKHKVKHLQERLNQVHDKYKAAADFADGNDAHVLSGVENLKLGGEWATALYDTVIPNAARALGKKFGAQLEDVAVYGVTGEPQTVHSMTLPPAMRDAALGEGFELFQGKVAEEQGAIQGSTLFRPDGSINIQFFEKANKSTFFHELAHYYTATLQHLTTVLPEGAARAQYTSDLESLRSWVGAKEGDALTVPQHEQIARGFEQYLQEGKAPSVALRNAFYRIREWMLKLYKGLAVQGVQLTPEVRGVFDRMLATDAEIAQAQQSEFGTPLFGENPQDLGLTPQQATSLQKAADEARQSVIEELTAERMKEVKREDSAEWKAQRDKVKAEVTAQVDAEPVQMAIAHLSKHETPAGVPLSEDLMPKVKLSKAALVAEYGEDILNGIPRAMVSDEGGVPADVVADVYGFANGRDFLDAVRASKPRTLAIREQTDARMQAEYGERMTDAEAQQKATELVHGIKQEDLLRKQMQVLASEHLGALKGMIKAVTKVIPSREAVKLRAKAVVDGTTIAALRPDLFRTASVREGKAARDLLLKGDLDGAFRSVERQLFATAIYNEALAQRRMLDDSMQRFQKAFGPDARLEKTRDLSFVNGARALLAEVGIGASDKGAADYLELVKTYSPETYQAVQDLTDNIRAMGIKNYKQMTVAQFHDLRETYEQIWAMGKLVTQYRVEGNVLTMQKVLDTLVPQMYAQAGKAPMAGVVLPTTVSDVAKKGMQVLTFKNSARRIESWTRAMDGARMDGDFHRLLFDKVARASEAYRVNRAEVRAKLAELAKGLEALPKLKDVAAPELGLTADGKPVVFHDRAELFGALRHRGNAEGGDSNFAKLLVGRGWGSFDENGVLDSSKWDAFEKRMWKEGILTKADYDFVQGVWDLFEEGKPAAQAAQKAVTGRYFAEVTATPFQTPFGEYAGGYYPAKADPFLSPDAALRADADALLGTNIGKMFPSPPNGFTKSRSSRYFAPLSVDGRTLYTDMDAVLKYTHLAAPVREVARLTTNRDFRDALSLVDPTFAQAALTPWLQRSASQTTDTPSTTRQGKLADTVFRWARANGVMQITGLNAIIAAEQMTHFPSIFGMLDEHGNALVGPADVANALVQYTKNPQQASATVHELSAMMRTREGDLLRESTGELERMLFDESKFITYRDNVIKGANILTRSISSVQDHVVWMGAYNAAEGRGLTGDAQVRYADRVVREGMGSYNPEDISAQSAGTQLGKALLGLYGFWNTKANAIGTDAFAKVMSESGLKRSTARAGQVYILSFLVPMVLGGMIRQAASGKPLDKDEDGVVDDMAKLFVTSQVEGAISMFPYGRAVTGTAAAGFQWLTGEKAMQDNLLASPAINAMESSLRGVGAAAKGLFSDKQMTGKDIQDVFTLIGMATGTPARALAKPLQYLHSEADGTATPTGPLDFTRGLLTGQRGGK